MKKKIKPNILISSCILGNKVRHNGGHTRLDWVTDVLGKHVNFIPICPEVDMGLGTPRESIHLEYSKDKISVVTKSGVDISNKAQEILEKYHPQLAGMEIHGAILQSKSPSCGVDRVKLVNSKNGMPDNRGSGFFAKWFMENYPLVPIIDSGRLQNERLRDIFMIQLNAHVNFLESSSNARELQLFHRQYKYLLMCFCQNGLKELGRLASCYSLENKALYHQKFINTLRVELKVSNIKNSLYHMLGYLKNDISLEDKRFIHNQLEHIDQNEIVGGTVKNLLHFLVLKYKKEYLKNQSLFSGRF